MRITARPNRWSAALAALCGLATWTGCNPCATIPHGAIPNPLGTHTCCWQTAHATAAEQDDFVLYQYDWYQGGGDLGPNGRYRLEHIAPRLAHEPYPVVVERTEDEALNQTRRIRVVEFLTARGVDIAPERVVVGQPEAEGLYGQAAPRVYQGMFGGRRYSGTGGYGGGSGISTLGGSFGGFRGGYGSGFQSY